MKDNHSDLETFPSWSLSYLWNILSVWRVRRSSSLLWASAIRFSNSTWRCLKCSSCCFQRSSSSLLRDLTLSSPLRSLFKRAFRFSSLFFILSLRSVSISSRSLNMYLPNSAWFSDSSLSSSASAKAFSRSASFSKRCGIFLALERSVPPLPRSLRLSAISSSSSSSTSKLLRRLSLSSLYMASHSSRSKSPSPFLSRRL
mmetsp:Transcript_49236/g.76882  ORF Transcript_49236/g.76882 Transcript_49236/m.76882 type:complete len:200 (-) Transcript_49236:262-861(-)